MIPNHRNREIATGTLRSILKQLDLTEEDLRGAWSSSPFVICDLALPKSP